MRKKAEKLRKREEKTRRFRAFPMGYAEDCQKSKKAKKGSGANFRALCRAGSATPPARSTSAPYRPTRGRAPGSLPLRGGGGRSGLPGLSPDVHQGDGSTACRYLRRM